MSKKDKFETIEVEDVNLLPDLLDGNHRDQAYRQSMVLALWVMQRSILWICWWI